MTNRMPVGFTEKEVRDIASDAAKDGGYVTSISASGTKVTYQKSDGTSDSFNTQDTDTWRPVVDNLNSSSSSDCLSANQGRLLNGGISTLNSNKKNKSDFSFNSGNATLAISV